MNRREIIQSVLSNPPHKAENCTPGPDCPEPAVLAAWVEAAQAGASMSIPGGEKGVPSTLDKHLADCPFCSFQLALITRSQAEEATASVPVEMLRQVMQPAESTAISNSSQAAGKTRQAGWLPWAMAAALVLVVGTAVYRQPGQVAVPTETAPPQTRYASQIALNPQVLSPLAGSQVRLAELVVRWSEVPGSLFYDVNLVDADGELLLRERVKGNRWLIPENLGLQAGADYYIRVDAWLNEAKFLSSEHIAFSVERDE